MACRVVIRVLECCQVLGICEHKELVEDAFTTVVVPVVPDTSSYHVLQLVLVSF